MELRRAVKARNVNRGTIHTLMLFKAVGLADSREGRVAGKIKWVKAKPWIIPVWRIGRQDGASKGG